MVELCQTILDAARREVRDIRCTACASRAILVAIGAFLLAGWSAWATGPPHLGIVEVQTHGVDGAYGLLGAWSSTLSPDGRHLYVAGKADHRVAVFSIDAATGALRFVETVRDDEGGVDGLQGASSVAVSPKGKYLYVTGNWAQAIAVFRVVTP